MTTRSTHIAEARKRIKRYLNYGSTKDDLAGAVEAIICALELDEEPRPLTVPRTVGGLQADCVECLTERDEAEELERAARAALGDHDCAGLTLTEAIDNLRRWGETCDDQWMKTLERYDRLEAENRRLLKEAKLWEACASDYKRQLVDAESRAREVDKLERLLFRAARERDAIAVALDRPLANGETLAEGVRKQREELDQWRPVVEAAIERDSALAEMTSSFGEDVTKAEWAQKARRQKEARNRVMTDRTPIGAVEKATQPQATATIIGTDVVADRAYFLTMDLARIASGSPPKIAATKAGQEAIDAYRGVKEKLAELEKREAPEDAWGRGWLRAHRLHPGEVSNIGKPPPYEAPSRETNT